MKARGWMWLIILGIVFVLPGILLFADVPFRITFILALIIGAGVGVAGARVSVADLFYYAFIPFVIQSQLTDLLQRYHSPATSAWSNVWTLVLAFFLGFFAIMFLAILVRFVIKRPALLLPLIGVPLLTLMTRGIYLLPFIIGLLAGIGYGYLLPPFDSASSKAQGLALFSIGISFFALYNLLFGFITAFKEPHTILNAEISALLAMFGASLLIYLLRYRKARQMTGENAAI